MKRIITALSIVAASLSLQAQAVRQFRLTDVRQLPSRFYNNMQRDSAWVASIDVNRLLHSFRNTAGVFTSKEGGYMTVKKLGGWESLDCDLRGHITGHLLSAMANLQMRAKADSLVQGLAEVQRQYGTGYLSAFGEGLIDRNIQGKSVWAPFYTLHKILQGLIDQYTMCDNKTALDVARGMGDWAADKLLKLDDETRRRMLRNEFGGFNEAMYNLYAITRDERHLQVARYFYHNDKVDPLKQGNADLGTNHANTFIPKLLGECRNYEMFGSDDSRQAAELLFWTLANDHAFVTGEVSDKEHLFKPETQSKHLTGYDGENCCTYNLLKLADHVFGWNPRSSIADYYERALYNHILGQQDPETSMVCYFTPLMTGAYRLYSTRDSSFWCCVGSGFECHSRYQSSIYFYNDRQLYVNLFIPSELTWDGTVVSMTTEFPADGRVTLTVRGKTRKFDMKLRCPWWATSMKVNGRKAKVGSDGYATLSRTWREGDRLTVEYGMELHEEATKDDKSRVALMYGPIVLGARLATVDHPFSNPKKYNDYYTFDYGRHPDIEYRQLTDFRQISPLHFETSDGTKVEPLYDLHHCRYGVYWKKQK
ncbi:MAG: beta-L-arabinofuranosidase domain-containing protein [Prevotella sp.]